MLGDYYETYKDAELRIYEFSILVLIYEENHDFLAEVLNNNFIDFNTCIKYLETKGYVKWHGDKIADISMRKPGETLFKKHLNKKKKPTPNVHLWIDKWREIFPEGVNNLGYRYRGNKAECLIKMIKFVDSNDFSEEEIFKATKNYVDRFAIRGYAYMQQAHYFIHKRETGSALVSECEGLGEQSEQSKQGSDYGTRLI